MSPTSSVGAAVGDLCRFQVCGSTLRERGGVGANATTIRWLSEAGDWVNFCA